MLFLYCYCYAFVPVCLLMPCGHLLGKRWPLDSRLWCLIVKLSLSHLYPWSGVVLDCIDSWSLPFFLLSSINKQQLSKYTCSGQRITWLKNLSIQVRLPLIVPWILTRLARGLNQIPEKIESNMPIFSDFQTKIWLKSYWRATEFFGCSSIILYPDLCPLVVYYGQDAVIFPGYLLQNPCKSDQH